MLKLISLICLKRSLKTSSIEESVSCTNAMEVLDYLLSKPFYPSVNDINSNSPLHYAVKSGNKLICEKLVKAGISKRVVNFQKRTPWMLAIELKQEHLYDVVSDIEGINEPIEYQQSYLDTACQLKNPDMVKVFLDAGADMKCYSSTIQWSALFKALWNKDEACVKTMLFHPKFIIPTDLPAADVDLMFRFIVRLEDFENMLERLVTLGVCQSYGHFASKLLISNCDHFELVKWMIQHGVNPNVVINGCYCLEQCCSECDEALEYLIMQNADPSLTVLDVDDMDDEVRVPPLIVLICRNEYELSRLAFAAGFDTTRLCELFTDTTVKDYMEEFYSEEPSDEIIALVDVIKEHSKVPRSLKTACRTVIMKQLGSYKTDSKIKQLGLPLHVEEYLHMKSFIDMRICEIDKQVELAKERKSN